MMRNRTTPTSSNKNPRMMKNDNNNNNKMKNKTNNKARSNTLKYRIRKNKMRKLPINKVQRKTPKTDHNNHYPPFNKNLNQNNMLRNKKLNQINLGRIRYHPKNHNHHNKTNQARFQKWKSIGNHSFLKTPKTNKESHRPKLKFTDKPNSIDKT